MARKVVKRSERRSPSRGTTAKRTAGREPAASAHRGSSGATSQHHIVVLRDVQGTVIEINDDAPFKATAERWSYILQSRRHWANRNDTLRKQAERACKELKQFECDEGLLTRIAQAGHVEVSITDNGQSFAQRVPWEYLLSAATRELRKGAPLLITRRLVTGRSAPMREPLRGLYIESAPGRLSSLVDFQNERQIVQSGLGIRPSDMDMAKSESEDKLREHLKKGPDVVHFTGFDARESDMLLGKTPVGDKQSYGVVLKGPDGRPLVATPEHFGTILKEARRLPTLVAFNCYNCGTDMAVGAVRAGASAAIGFQDEIDDEIAELFFGTFYREWRLAKWDVHQGFRACWQALRDRSVNIHGTGIILWTAESAFEKRPVARPTVAARKSSRASKPESEPPPAARVLIEPQIESEINYSLLHNGQPIFRSFLIHRVVEGDDPLEVEITVKLHLGTESYPFLTTARLEKGPLSLTDIVKIPLTSELARSLRERVQSTLYVKVCVAGKVEYQNTTAVTLLPVDEWSDDERQPTTRDPIEKRSVWLPSFVLPRDPGVARIIDSAQRYLMALTDDPGAGFDGYQQLAPKDPTTRSAVDLQVRALWCALSYESRLSYINPPPSYSLRTQRLRTPTDVLAGRRGTCIDLALLLAACLEYVDIYPAIFLLKGHAFPAYWRSDEAHEDFLLADPSASAPATSPPSVAPTSGESTGSRFGWAFNDKRQFGELMQCIHRGDLVPLETVWLTNNSSFEEAREAGLQNLRNPREFDSMLDILEARRHAPPVTPLPIIQYENGQK